MTKTSPKSDICVIFGPLRSGTTMLRLMVNGHPRFVCPGESDFLVDHLVLSQDGRWHYDLDALAADRVFKASGARLPTTDEAITAFRSMLADLRGPSGDCLVLVLHRGLGKLLQLEPHIKILHLLRDPRDVARSAIGMGWAGNVYYGVRTWLVTENEWEQVSVGLTPDQFLEFKYEALIRKPKEILNSVCTFLGYCYDSDMLNYPNSSTYAPVDPSLAEQWRRKLSERELGLIEPLFGELMTKRGYAPSGHPPINPTYFERLQLRAEHSYSVWRRRISKYGLLDPVFVRLFTKIGVPKLAKSAQERMDVITRRHLK